MNAVILVVVVLTTSLVLRSCRPGPAPRRRAFDITYPTTPVSVSKRKKKR